MKDLKAKGIETVGYVETPISMAGWGVVWCAQALDMKCVIFEPQYKDGPPAMLRVHQQKWKDFGAIIKPITAGRTCVNYYIARKIFQKQYGPKAYLMPTGIPSEETVIETAREWKRTTEKHGNYDHVIISVGSGTICAGILRGIGGEQITGILCNKKNTERKRRDIFHKAKRDYGPLFSSAKQLSIIDAGWRYVERPRRVRCPFPCHAYYDLKAWVWLVRNVDNLFGRVLFWNIGSDVL
jgi:hypothetical protein